MMCWKIITLFEKRWDAACVRKCKETGDHWQCYLLIHYHKYSVSFWLPLFMGDDLSRRKGEEKEQKNRDYIWEKT